MPAPTHRLNLASLLLLCHSGLALAAATAIPAQLDQPVAAIAGADTVTQRCAAALTQAKNKVSELTQTASPDPLAEWNRLSLIFDEIAEYDLIANVHPDELVRKAAEQCTLDVTQYLVTLFQNPALYQMIAKAKPKDAIDAKLKSDLLFSFEETGIGLSTEKQQRFRELKKKYDELEQAFSRNIRDNTTKVSMSEAELAGLPESYVAALKKNDDGSYQLGFEYPQFYPFMTYASNAAARKRYMVAFTNRGTAANIGLLDEIVAVRTEIAALFGLPAYADYAIRRRMASGRNEVRAFLENVRGKISAVEAAEIDTLTRFRQQKEGLSREAAKIERPDVSYYDNLYKKATFNIDQESMRAYFPAEATISWALDMTSDLYGVTLKPRTVPVWHPDVRYVDVIDRRSGRVISGIFLDLYPRDGKYGHAAVWPLHGSSRLLGRRPVAALVTNFNRKGFNLDEVRTFLHEFGHAMHNALSDTRYLDQSGTNVERDFVEAPSQMYEEWGRRLETLSLVKRYCRDSCPAIDAELVARLEAADKFGKGIHYARQLLYADYDLTLYSPGKPAALPLWQRMEAATALGELPGGQFPGNFSHIAGGYAAAYYGYMWSQVIAIDMQSLFAPRLLDKKQGRRFRELVLAQGGQKRGKDLAASFLRRPPNAEAFFRKITGQ